MRSKLWNIRWNEQKLEHYGILVDLLETWELVHFNETYFKTFIVTSATLNAEKFCSYFFNCLYTKQPKTDYIDLAFITNHMEYSEQEYVVYVIYGHAA